MSGSARSRVLILVVSYQAEAFIESVLARIPDEALHAADYDTEILVVDDRSSDETFDVARRYAVARDDANITVLFNPVNLGYGGNQKVGYRYAIKNEFDAVVLLHGDGQYAPELLPEMIAPILTEGYDVVLGSRMLKKSDALRGGMPLYKWFGNQVLTGVQNSILGTHLAEFHTGYRAYRVSALAGVPFDRNSDYYDFDTDILIQLIDAHRSFKEIAVPTYYGEEISRVNGMRYGLLILYTSVISRLMRRGILYHRKFDYEPAQTHYRLKLGYPSSDEFAITRVKDGSKVVDIGCDPGLMAERLSMKGCDVVSIGRWLSPEGRSCSVEARETDLDTLELDGSCADADTILLLDVLEHLKSPETFLERLREACSGGGQQVIVTTANIAFLPMRLGLLLGAFSYGRRGVLDLTHTRLFTFRSMRRLLRQSGYRISEMRGLPAPFPLALGDNLLSRGLVRCNDALARVAKSLFAYQIACVATPLPTLQALLEHAEHATAQRVGQGSANG